MATVARFRGGQSVVLKDLIDVREFLSGEIKKSVKAMTSTSAYLGPKYVSSTEG